MRHAARRSLPWLVLVGVAMFALQGPLPERAAAQPTGVVDIDDTSIVEGSGGTVSLVFTLQNFFNEPVTAEFHTEVSSPGGGFNPPTGGASCGQAGVDFVQVSESSPVTVSVPGNGTATVSVVVCSDTVDEQTEQLFGLLAGPVCGDCVAVGAIRDDEPVVSFSTQTRGTVESETTRNATFDIVLSAASSFAVTVVATPVGVSATGGGSCTGDADFVNSGITAFFSPGVTLVQVSVPICGDTRDEPTETYVLNLTGGDGAALGDTQASGTIFDDDPAPAIGIANGVASEGNPCDPGTICSAFSFVPFTVTLSAASGRTVTVDYATANGSAVGGSDFQHRTGTVTFSPGDVSETITVFVFKDSTPEANETYSLSLVNPVNGVCNVITPTPVNDPSDCIAFGRIMNDDASSTGLFSLDPADAAVGVGEHVSYAFTWSVPAGGVWRDLNTLDLRIGDHGKRALWVRWSEATNAFSLCTPAHSRAVGVQCGPGAAPGTSAVLETPIATLHLAGTRAVGSGPTGPSVTLTLDVSFKDGAVGPPYPVQVAATDDSGNADAFVDAGTVEVDRAR